MPYKGCVDDFMTIRKGGTPSRVPVVACSEESDVKWYGKYEYEEFCQDTSKIVEVYKAAIDHFDYDWAWVQIDDCFEFEPVGVEVKGEGNILRATCGYLPVNHDTLDRLPRMDPNNDGRMPLKLRALSELREAYGDTVLVVGSFAAPFSAVGLMWGIEESMMLPLTDPPLLYDAMEYWKEFYMRYAKAQKDAGAHAIWLGDCNTFSSMLSVAQYNEHVFAITRELVKYCEEEVGLLVWQHNSEIEKDHVLSHVPLGHSIEGIGPDADIAEIREATRGKIAISGNLDPIEMLWRGTPEAIAEDVARIMGICKEGGAYVFGSGEMTPRQVPEENMLAMVRAAKALGEY